MPTPSELTALNIICPYAVQCENQSKIPAELTVAQWILESGWGKDSPQNNCFGIKAYPGAFGRQLLKTEEWFNSMELSEFLIGDGQRTAVLHQPPKHTDTKPARFLYDCQDWFATFPSIEACFAKHAELFTTPAYLPAFRAFTAGESDLATFVRAIGPVYAKSPTYADEVLTLISEPAVKTAISQAREQPSLPPEHPTT